MRLISSSLGDASLSLAGGATTTRVAILSGSNLDTILSVVHSRWVEEQINT